MAVWFWLLAAGVLFVVETITANLLFASLAFSAATAMVTAWAGGGFLAQGIAFAVSAVFSLAILRPLALREISKRTPKNATNTEALLGVSALTRLEITEYSGEIDLRGEVWSARSLTGTIPAQHRVIVSKIDGAIAIVESAPSPSSAL
jgi:membrane protein implicated in regulation of membrane protease activity